MGDAGQRSWTVLTIPCEELVWAGEALGRHTRIEAASRFWPRAGAPEFSVAAAGLEGD